MASNRLQLALGPGVVLAAVLALYAQSITGTILGTVRDSSSAVVPGASVVLTNDETGVQTVVVSDERGDFVLPNLSPGSYTVKVELAGFKPAVVKSVRLLANRSARTEPALEPGAVSQAVQVVTAGVVAT